MSSPISNHRPDPDPLLVDLADYALNARVDQMVDSCTRCGKCVEVCPITGAAGVTDSPQAVITGVLDIAVERCAADGNDCRPAGSYEYKDIGVAFEIADVDRDGTPDVIVSSASAPGDADAVRVIPLGSPTGKPAFKKPFNGGVAGIVVSDGDGDGVPEVVVVVRLAGATRVDLWRLD